MASPSLVVFDLDFTLWDCGGLWVDCTSHPFRKTATGEVVDNMGRRFRLYEDVLAILAELDELHIPLGVASRTDQPEWARDLLALFGIEKRLQFVEIYPGAKTAHFARLHDKSGFDFEEMLFFDDESRNIRNVGALGVQCVEVGGGINRDVFRGAMDAFH